MNKRNEWNKRKNRKSAVSAKGFVAESIGFVAELRMKTRGQAFAQLAFDHWQVWVKKKKKKKKEKRKKKQRKNEKEENNLNKKKIIKKSSVECFCIIKGFLPAAESIGFVAELRMKTRGQAFAQLAFDHWQVWEIHNNKKFT